MLRPQPERGILPEGVTSLSSLAENLGNPLFREQIVEGYLPGLGSSGLSSSELEARRRDLSLQLKDLEVFLKGREPAGVFLMGPFVAELVVKNTYGEGENLVSVRSRRRTAVELGSSARGAKIVEAAERLIEELLQKTGSSRWRNRARGENALETRYLVLNDTEEMVNILIEDTISSKRLTHGREYKTGGVKYYLVRLFEEKE